ncbi:hypothetical protein, partial [Chromatium okenii]|uniref:beta strand repeat-containing protein n=1 Tax=Chromatium okenii TaxID=61644 RepID=UPI0026F286F9
MTGTQYLGGATVKNIETLQIGTNIPGLNVAFDMNINQGAYEITSVNEIIYDQITTNETLIVQNIVPVAVGDVAPTLVWDNEANSAAGAAATTYREATVQGVADNQAIELINIDATQNQGTADGTLLIAPGMESFTITSTGTVAQNTLNNVQDNVALAGGYTDSSVNNTFADLISRGSLTKVVLDGATTIGREAGVVTDKADANYGLTDRAWVASNAGDGDLGLTLDDSASNLLSVGARVIEIDASAMTTDDAAITGAANVRFTAKTDSTATDVTFKGGAAGDYAEFELGNVTATTNLGDDTIAFITQAAGVTNSTFGSGDTVTGGEGSDTLQLGVNGIGTYTLSTTEFQNTTEIDVLDLRGAINTVTISSGLVDAADAGKFEIHTDRVVRTDNTNAGNPTNGINNHFEDGTENTIDLSELTSSQGVKFVGGSGSDRLVLDNDAFNQNMELSGGTNVGTYAPPVNTASGDYDTITVVNNAVMDSTDLSNVSGFEGLVLVDNVTGDSEFTVELTAAFLLKNTLGTDDVSTSINDRVFQIGTVSAANGSRLSSGDIVTIDISGLLNAGRDGLDSSITGRGIDVSKLQEEGVQIAWVVDGKDTKTMPVDPVPLVTLVDPNADDVMASAANAQTAGVGNTMTAQDAAFNTTNNFLLTGGPATADDDTLNSTAANIVGSTINMAAGQDILNITTAVTAAELAGVNTALAAAKGLETVNLLDGSGVNLVTVANGAGVAVNAYAASTVGLGSGGQAFSGLGIDITNSDDYVTTGTGADIVSTGAGNDKVNSIDTVNVDGDTIDGGAGDDTILIGDGNQTVDTGTGADVVFVNLAGVDTISIGGDLDADNVLIQNVDIKSANTDVVTIRGFDIANDSISLGLGAFGTEPAPTSNGLMIPSNTTTGLKALAPNTVLAIDTADAFSGATAAQMLAYMTKTLGVTAADNSIITVVAYDAAGNASLYQAQETNNAVDGAFDFIELVGIVQGVGVDALGADNFG